MNPQIHNVFASLGTKRGDTYTVNEDCFENLQEIFKNLIIEDRTLRTYRRAIGFGENVRKDLIPLLVNVKSSTKLEDSTRIIDITIKILLNLTIPVECLLSLDDEAKTEIGRHTIFELSRLLASSKEAFIDSRSTKAVVDHIKFVAESDQNLNSERCDSINNCLLLLRNVLHVPEIRISSTIASTQNQIIWNLFTQSMDKIIIYLMSSPQKVYWDVTIVQLIALLYKDQHVGTLQQLLSLWFEASLSDSSEDNESNTSPQNECSCESSPVITSDLTSDSSDNGGGEGVDRSKSSSKACSSDKSKSSTDEVIRPIRVKGLMGMKRGKSTETDASTCSGGSQSTDSGICTKKDYPQAFYDGIKFTQAPHDAKTKTLKKFPSKAHLSELSDCGYSTQIETRGESISTSSNDDEQPPQKLVHQKPFQKNRHTNKNKSAPSAEKKELRRKKLVKRSKTNIINMKGLMHHTPTDEDITNLLKEFMLDFLLKSYASLVRDLHAQLLTTTYLPMDTSHFFWLITYFLKVAVQLELDLELLNPVLSYDIISYLVFQGVWLYEELEIGFRERENDLRPSLRRLHLVVTAIREFLQAIETYEKVAHLTEEDRDGIISLQEQVSEMDELKKLFLLLLRQYNPKLQSKQYLQDLIVTNHSYLLLLDKFKRHDDTVVRHLKEFAAVDVMRRYGILLEQFQEVGEHVNNCIFTMMHHVAGDLGNISALFQPNILKTFSQIWENDYEICDDWSDLIEYVIHRFINISKNGHHIYADSRGEKQETDDILYENVLTQHETRDVQQLIAQIIKDYRKSTRSNSLKSQNLIVKELLVKNMELRDKDDSLEAAQSDMFDYNSWCNADVEDLKTYLIEEGKEACITWLQDALIEACYAKLAMEDVDEKRKSKIQPIAYYYTLLNLPIPLVPWTAEQCSVIKHQPFVLLLHKLGFILPLDIGKVFVRIPNFWTADYLFSIAERLGPITTGIEPYANWFTNAIENTKFVSEKLKCNLLALLSKEKTNFDVGKPKVRNYSVVLNQAPSILRYMPLPNTMEWCTTVLESDAVDGVDSLMRTHLSIDIPETETACDLPPPQLSMVCSTSSTNHLPGLRSTEIECLIGENEDVDRNSETTSIASDLTRMCVSDEDERMLCV